MLTPNVKVVSALTGWRRIVALFGAGVGLLGVVFGLAEIVPIPIRAQLVVMLILITGVLVSLSFSEQRLRRSCFEAVAAGTGLTVSYAALLLWTFTRAGTNPRGALTIAVFGLVLVLLCLAIRVIGLWFVRSFIRRLVVQTGSLCWTCAYDLTGNESGVCPECGTKIGVPAREPES